MGAIYRNKRSAGCGLCKPWKHGQAPKFKDRERGLRRELEKESKDAERVPVRRDQRLHRL